MRYRHHPLSASLCGRTTTDSDPSKSGWYQDIEAEGFQHTINRGGGEIMVPPPWFPILLTQWIRHRAFSDKDANLGRRACLKKFVAYPLQDIANNWSLCQVIFLPNHTHVHVTYDFIKNLLCSWKIKTHLLNRPPLSYCHFEKLPTHKIRSFVVLSIYRLDSSWWMCSLVLYGKSVAPSVMKMIRQLTDLWGPSTLPFH